MSATHASGSNPATPFILQVVILLLAIAGVISLRFPGSSVWVVALTVFGSLLVCLAVVHANTLRGGRRGGFQAIHATGSVREDRSIQNLCIIAQEEQLLIEIHRQMTRELTSIATMQDVLERTLNLIHTAVPFQEAQVLLLEGDNQLALAKHHSAGAIGRHPTRFPRMIEAHQVPAIAVLLNRQDPILLKDAKTDKRLRSVLMEELGVSSWLGIPLVSGGRLIGILSCSSSLPHAFSARDLRRASSLAPSVALAVEITRLRERAEICTAELERCLNRLEDKNAAC